MPRLAHALPNYRLHRASGQAVVTLNGRDHYLGPYGSSASYQARDLLISQWLANGRATFHTPEPAAVLRVNDLAAQYWRHAKNYYVKNGEPTGELTVIKPALRRLCTAYGELPASELSPLALEQLQTSMIAEDLARTYINKQVERIRRAYRWAVSKQLVPVTTYQALCCVVGLKKGRTVARETKAVAPVSDADVQATLPFLPLVVADMVRFQRLVGCRPEEVWGLRPCDVDRDGAIWYYTPDSHKTEHHQHDRRIAVGPKAQAILGPYLRRAPQTHCFSPSESEGLRRTQQRSVRQTPVQPSQQDRRAANPRRFPGNSYDTRTYNRAIARACKRAGIAKWSPNQLRHAAATETRRQFGLEAAQAVLGQRRIEVTQIYAQRRDDLATEVAEAIG